VEYLWPGIFMILDASFRQISTFNHFFVVCFILDNIVVPGGIDG